MGGSIDMKQKGPTIWPWTLTSPMTFTLDLQGQISEIGRLNDFKGQILKINVYQESPQILL